MADFCRFLSLQSPAIPCGSGFGTRRNASISDLEPAMLVPPDFLKSDSEFSTRSLAQGSIGSHEGRPAIPQMREQICWSEERAQEWRSSAGFSRPPLRVGDKRRAASAISTKSAAESLSVLSVPPTCGEQFPAADTTNRERHLSGAASGPCLVSSVSRTQACAAAHPRRAVDRSYGSADVA